MWRAGAAGVFLQAIERECVLAAGGRPVRDTAGPCAGGGLEDAGRCADLQERARDATGRPVFNGQPLPAGPVDLLGEVDRAGGEKLPMFFF